MYGKRTESENLSNTCRSLQSIQGGLRFSNEVFTALSNRCTSELQTNHSYGVNRRAKSKKEMLDTIATPIISFL